MGYAKRLLMEEQARLYHTSEDAVCPSCFHDSGIKAFIKSNLECKECSVCGKTSRRAIAARADRVLEFFLDRVHRHYQDADGIYLGNAGQNAFEYVRFMTIVVTQICNVCPPGDPQGMLKHMDEFNYCRFTKGWL